MGKASLDMLNKLKSGSKTTIQKLKDEAVKVAEAPKKGIMKILSPKTEPFRLFFKDMFFDIHTNDLKHKDK